MSALNNFTKEIIAEGLESEDVPEPSVPAPGSVTAGSILYSALIVTWPPPGPRFSTLSAYDKARLERAAAKVIEWHNSQNEKLFNSPGSGASPKP